MTTCLTPQVILWKLTVTLKFEISVFSYDDLLWSQAQLVIVKIIFPESLKLLSFIVITSITFHPINLHCCAS